jgi:DNA-binding IclR family transcriptional regulator
VLLAHLPPEELELLCAEEPELAPPEGAQAFADLLDRVRARGYARGGIQGESLAVAVGLPPIAALAVAGPIEPEQEPELAERLRQAAARIGDLSTR